MPYLRVMPVGDLPVPTHDGTKHVPLFRRGAPKDGHIVADNVHNRRRVLFGELDLIEELASYPQPPEDVVPPAIFGAIEQEH